MKVLVTGASGFIGQEIVKELEKKGFEVFSVAGLKSAREVSDTNKNNKKIFFTDIANSETFTELKKMVSSVDVVIHSAGLAHQFGDTEKEAFDRVNVLGTKNVTNLAFDLGAKHFILIGSTAVYGIKPAISEKSDSSHEKFISIDETTETVPQTLYAHSKLESERVCKEICENKNIRLTIFRLAPVIGEANVGNVARLIETVRKGRFFWVGKGENYKSLIYKNDVARACVELIGKKIPETEIFNLAAPPIKMKDFVNEIARLLDKKIYNFYLPKQLFENVFSLNERFLKIGKIGKIKDTIEKWLSDDVYSAAKIAEKYDFKTQTTIYEGLAKQIKANKSADL
jgi:nucleoside-diphosphate-sugar epimerase